ncbi:MAG: DNA repair protein RadC [Erysipelotrichaceae bacterium]|nr:DNA repair protein RadC [Erysipelotrichaceae bacterium]MDD4643018.1 DNA repair protein RadC [Erysipelotrichaceae bacterium]
MIKVQELPVQLRPRERAVSVGVENLHDRELLAILIRHGYQGCSALGIADELLNKYGLAKLPSLSLKQITNIKGIKKVKALELLACFELSNRIMSQQIFDEDVIDNSQKLVKWLRSQLGFVQQEHFIVVFLNTKNHIITYKTLFVGSLDVSVAHPREIFKEAVACSAAKFIAVHNHPSGDVTPSEKDVSLTDILSKAGKMMGIPLIDHLIVSRFSYHSIMHNME